MTIEFGDWRLVPCEGNWELAHRHVAQRGKDAGKVKWNRTGHYYQHDTIANALLYAADWEMRNDGSEGAAAWLEYAERYKAMIESFKNAAQNLL